jgi:RNA polymerase sigma factor (sigma-70 family)
MTRDNHQQGMSVGQPDEAGAQSPETIEELFDDLESPLLGYALRLIGEREVAEDLVQEAFMKLHAHFAEVREPRRWLYRTVHNLALNHRRDTARMIPLQPQHDEAGAPVADTADPQPLPDEQIARLEGIGLVRLSLAALDGRSRELIRLKFNEDLSYAQISERTGLKTGHVGYLLHHALKAIAAELAKTGVVP